MVIISPISVFTRGIDILLLLIIHGLAYSKALIMIIISGTLQLSLFHHFLFS